MGTRLDPLEVTALGRVAKLGEFYDVRSDKFLHECIFQSDISKITTITENKETKLKFALANTFEEKFTVLDISAQLQVSILFGLVSLNGSGRFLKDFKTSAKSAKASLLLSVATKDERVSLMDSAIRPNINLDLLSQIDATHVVVGIQWGGNVFISVEDQNSDNKDVQKVQGNLEASVKWLAASISGKGNVDYDESEKSKLSNFNFEVYGDLLPEQVPQTLLDALDFMKRSPGLICGANNGKGKALKYVLLPVEEVRKLLKIECAINNIIKNIDETTVMNCVKFFDRMMEISQTLNDIHGDVMKFKNHLAPDKIRKIEDLKMEFSTYRSEISAQLGQLLKKVRSDEEDIEVFRRTLMEATKQTNNLWHTANMDILTNTNHEISFLQLLQKQNVLLFDRTKLFNQFLWENREHDLYVLFYKFDKNFLSDPSMNNLKTIIDNKNKDQSTELIMAIDYDLIDKDPLVETWSKINKICVFQNARLVFDNYPEGDENLEESSSIWSLHQIQKRIQDLERQIVPIGFIYVQLANQLDPDSLWPGTSWKNISEDYEGCFFRAEGGKSEIFGETQYPQAPERYISQLETSFEQPIENGDCTESCDLLKNDWTPWIYTGDHCEGKNAIPRYLTFKSVSTECDITPWNQAVRIWKRMS